MLNLLHLSWKSLRFRRLTVGLTLLSISLSVSLLLGVGRLRREVQDSFTNTVSGTDLVVGARTGSLQLLLSSVFRIGDASNNMQWESFLMIQNHPEVKWTIPVSLGDSHQGFRVMGTTGAYLEHLQYGQRRPLEFESGAWFSSDSEAVIGAEVARKLGYAVGDQLVVAHGAGSVSFIQHQEHPFTITGILKPTGTPVDRTVHVNLSGITAIHAGMTSDGSCEHEHDPLHVCSHADEGANPSITAVFVGLKSRVSVLGLQRSLNEYEKEPLSAIMPGLVLQELWGILGILENVLVAISFFVVIVGLAGMMVALMSSLNERRREMAILRSVGARPGHIFSLIIGESMVVIAAGVFAGFVLINLLFMLFRPLAISRFGIVLNAGLPSGEEIMTAGIILLIGLIAGLVPAYRSYRYSLVDGLTIKL